MLCSLSDAKQFKLRIKICELEGLVTDDIPNKDTYKVQVHINLGIPKRGYVPRITNQKDHTSKQQVGLDGRVCWNEGFEHRCNNLDTKGVNLKSWKINLQVHVSIISSYFYFFLLKHCCFIYYYYLFPY